MTQVKLCGLTRAADVEAANQLQADYVGFVYAPHSRRRVSVDQARQLRRGLSSHVSPVGVFVNAPVEFVAGLLNDGTIELAQLHGDEDENYLAELRRLSPKPIIQAFRLRQAEAVAAAHDSSADYVLVDSGSGSGEVFDWELARQLRRPYFLAGGLSPLNINCALTQLAPYGVDVSSGIETDGVKDHLKMKQFVQAVREFGGSDD